MYVYRFTYTHAYKYSHVYVSVYIYVNTCVGIRPRKEGHITPYINKDYNSHVKLENLCYFVLLEDNRPC